MNSYPVAFVSFEEFDNLGVGYMASLLSDNGYKPWIIDFRYGKEEILRVLTKLKPYVVGFSVIFQYHIYEFRRLMNYLRKGGIKCHFTAGGHYASLRYEELFELIPSLDSVVRFEGEYTMLELVYNICSKSDWRKIKGIAYKENGKISANPLRPLEKDLDRFPFPTRLPPAEYALDKKFATILAGRGCIHDCAFCDIREFYQQPPGPYKRIRRPEMVVREMELLYHEKDCSVFLFQDDDFPIKTDKGSEWISNFCKGLKDKRLHNKIMWKINCRPDEVDYESFALMKNHGLFLVFLGIEDGTNTGLIRLNKHMTVARSLEGINTLKNLEIGFDYGFMLFQPASTFRMIHQNLDFLKLICGDGYTPVSFLKMLPYFETKVEKELLRDGRLKGKPGFLDYDFLDKSIDLYFSFINDRFLKWLMDPEGLSNISKWARNYISLFSKFYKKDPEVIMISEDVRKIISESNNYLLETMKDLANLFETREFKNTTEHDELKHFNKEIRQKHNHFKEKINDCMTKLLYIYQTVRQVQDVESGSLVF